MRVLVDIDGVLCELTPWEGVKPKDYLEAIPIQKNIHFVSELKGFGVEIFLFTARLPRFRDVTKQWLKENNVQYDGIIYGKPWCDYCIDDKCTTFDNILSRFYPKTNRTEGRDDVQKREFDTPTKTQRRTSGKLAVTPNVVFSRMLENTKGEILPSLQNVEVYI